jgi:hypothetical protein
MADATSGTGGGLRYITEVPTADMVNQGLPLSCVVACVRQLLRDAGAEVSEAALIEKIGILEGVGSTAESAAATLSDLHPRLHYLGGPLEDDKLFVFLRRDPWIAFVKTDYRAVHSVIVDRSEVNLVYVRDPWGLAGPGSGAGTRATLTLTDFRNHWGGAIYNGVVPNAIK